MKWAEDQASTKRYKHLHGQVVLESLGRYNLYRTNNIVIPRYLAEHLHKKLGELLSEKKIVE